MKTNVQPASLPGGRPVKALLAWHEPLPLHGLARPPLLKKRVLIVDDSPQVRSSLARVMVAEGYLPLLASNGREAIDILFTQEVDLVLMDLAMPELNGWQALQQLSEKLHQLPVIVMTGHTHQRQWVERFGARALLEKPFEPALMVEVVHQILGDRTHHTDWEMRPESRFLWKPAQPLRDNTNPDWGINE
jgi:DNA-binding NtrC family response regulator